MSVQIPETIPMKRSCVLCCLLLLFALITLSGTAQTPATNESTASRDVRGLNTAYIDKSADPCQDFFQYACGKFSSMHPIPPDRSSFGSMAVMADENQRILHAIV